MGDHVHLIMTHQNHLPPPTLTSQPLSGRLTMTDPWVFIQRLSKSLSFIKRGAYFVYIWYTSFKSANCNRPLHYAPMHLLISLPCFIWRVDTSKIAWSSFINTVCYNMTNVYDKSTLPWTCWFFFHIPEEEIPRCLLEDASSILSARLNAKANVSRKSNFATFFARCKRDGSFKCYQEWPAVGLSWQSDHQGRVMENTLTRGKINCSREQGITDLPTFRMFGPEPTSLTL